MSEHRTSKLIAAVAFATLAAAAGMPAAAQTRVNQDGRALDANNRVGSDGSNDRNNNIDRRRFTGNQVVTGNVTGGRSFRGTVNYGDPLEFRGRISRPSDSFVRDSFGAPTRTEPQTRYGQQATAFYGDRRATAPPPGFRAEGFTGGYYNRGVGQTTTVTGVSNPVFQSTTRVFDAGNPLLRSGEAAVFDGRSDGRLQPTLLSASPLYGVRPLNEGLLGETGAGLSRSDTISRRSPSDRFSVNRGQIEEMRRELNGAAGERDAQPPANDLSRPLQQQPLGQTPGASAGTNLSGSPLQTRLSGDRLSGSAQTSQGQQRRLVIPPAQQSKQYAEMQRRLEQRQGGRPLSDVEANRQVRMLRNAQAAPGAPGADGDDASQPQDGGPRGVLAPATSPPQTRGGGGGGARPQPRVPQSESPRPAVKSPPAAEQPAAPDEAPVAPEAEPQAAAPATPAESSAPLRVKSLAEGVDAKGLRELLTSAEALMRDGKFASAIEKYATAQQVAPNNPLILLGRAQAELGATYYGRAERSLRGAVETDPALLMAQYDLESFMGRERLGFLVKDLKQIAANEPESSLPMLLLAYIAYNTPGSESGAAQYLDAAVERAGKPDALVDLMRKHWNLSGGSTAPAADEPAAAPDAGDEDLNK